MIKSDYLKLFFCIFICEMAGVIGSFFTAPAINGWYSQLNRPFFNPPDWVFAPAWTTLFCMIGISLFLVTKDGLKGKQLYLVVFIIQLLLNSSWSIAFFGLQSILGGFIIVLLLEIFIVMLIIKSYKYSKLASYLLIPYCLWVGFATVLNGSFLYLN